jgi:hypothetical protein
MTSALRYASISIVNFHAPDGIAIESISIDGLEAKLSGAWYLAEDSQGDFENILHNSLILTLGKPSIKYPPSSREIFLGDFIQEAKALNLKCAQLFAKHIASDKKYKNLKEPELCAWEYSDDLEKSESIMDLLKQTSTYSSTDPEMREVLASAKYVVYLLSKWFEDQVIRTEKKYLNLEISNQILPECWFTHLRDIRNAG